MKRGNYPPAKRAGRVVHSHTIARRAMAAAALFAAVAVIWAALVLLRGGSWWGPLHTFLVGTVLLAISGASQMFTITWAASPAPPAWLAGLQRWLVIAGAAGILVGVTVELDWLVWLGAVAVIGGLGTLSASIIRAVRRSLLRRFDLSARFYLTAFGAGMIGVVLGAILGSGWVAEPYARVRLVHYHLNLVGLVGFTIIGTLPTFLPTVAHHRAVSGREAIVAWWLCIAAGIAFFSGLFAPPAVIGVGSALAALAAALVLGGVVGRLWQRGRGRMAFLQIGAGVVWLISWAVLDAFALLVGDGFAPFSVWTTAAVVTGVGQVLLGSLAYLTAVLLGPPLGRRMEIFEERWALPLIAANAGGIALVSGWPLPALIGFAIWLADFGWRLLRQKGLALEK
jgi:nitrite reductase (NO-forming)